MFFASVGSPTFGACASPRPGASTITEAIDKPGIIETRARHWRAHRIHLDESGKYGVQIVSAGPLVAEDGETPVGSLFVVEANDRAAIDAFTRTDPYSVHGVWQTIDVHYY